MYKQYHKSHIQYVINIYIYVNMVHIYLLWDFIVNLPIENVGSFHSSIKLPEGNQLSCFLLLIVSYIDIP